MCLRVDLWFCLFILIKKALNIDQLKWFLLFTIKEAAIFGIITYMLNNIKALNSIDLIKLLMEHNYTGFALWSVCCALLHALVCTMPGTPRDEGTTTGKFYDTYDCREPSTSAGNDFSPEAQFLCIHWKWRWPSQAHRSRDSSSLGLSAKNGN